MLIFIFLQSDFLWTHCGNILKKVGASLLDCPYQMGTPIWPNADFGQMSEIELQIL